MTDVFTHDDADVLDTVCTERNRGIQLVRRHRQAVQMGGLDDPPLHQIG